MEKKSEELSYYLIKSQTRQGDGAEETSETGTKDMEAEKKEGGRDLRKVMLRTRRE